MIKLTVSDQMLWDFLWRNLSAFGHHLSRTVPSFMATQLTVLEIAFFKIATMAAILEENFFQIRTWSYVYMYSHLFDIYIYCIQQRTQLGQYLESTKFCKLRSPLRWLYEKVMRNIKWYLKTNLKILYTLQKVTSCSRLKVVRVVIGTLLQWLYRIVWG